MKKHIFTIMILTGLAISVQASQHSDPNEIKSASLSDCFSGGCLVNDCLILNAAQDFPQLSEEDQSAAVRQMLDNIEAKRAIVKSSNGSTLWHVKDGVITSLFLGNDKFNPDDYSYANLDRLGSSRWFLTFGGQLGYNDNFTIGANARGGAYLLRDILDLGLGVNVNVLVPDEGDESVMLMFDLSSRLYLSKWMPRSRIAPYAGLGLGYSVDVANSDSSGSVEPVISAGANWYLSKGSIDIGLQYGTERNFCFNIGYTLSF